MKIKHKIAWHAGIHVVYICMIHGYEKLFIITRRTSIRRQTYSFSNNALDPH